MKTVLMVAEKPSLALSIAKILSNGRVNSRKGISPACQVHEYHGTFIGHAVKFKMTSVCGHVMSLDFRSQYNNWDSVDPGELFEAPTRKKEAMENLNIPKFLESEARGVDYLVLWLDCDKEGENICFEVVDCAASVMKRGQPGEKVIFRAKFSAVTDKDIRYAMQNLTEPNKNESLSVDARQELDLRMGCAFTRFQTRYFQGKYGDLDSSLISYGPCQTPTLGFCVERHDQIQSFKPEPYWQLQVEIKLHSGQNVKLDWSRIRVFDRDVGNMFHNMVKGFTEASVISVTTKEKSKPRPGALNTVEMLRVASSSLGIGPQQTMQIAERLYIQGYISYPRTETTQYSENFDLVGTLRQQADHPAWGSYVKELIREGIAKPKKGTDVGDHPPITPMKPAYESELSNDSWRLYDYITRHFIASVSFDCKYMLTSVGFRVNKEEFSCEGKTMKSPGFTTIMYWLAIQPEESIPHFQKGDVCDIKEVRLVEKLTSPPDLLSESELISKMEKHGIGTDASIPVHINNICQRNYVQVTSGRRLQPTSLGIVLVHGYQKIDPELVLPTMRAALEKQLNLIAQGKADFNAVLHHSINCFNSKFEYFRKNIENMDELFEVSFTKLSESGKPLSRCGKCHRFMKLITAKPCRLHCAHCDETYSLPNDGNLKLFKELRCPLDEFELLLYAGRGGKSTPLCPYCYNHPPFEDMRKGMCCNQCTHPTCKHSIASLSVASCIDCDSGTLMFDPTSAPKWRMACNKCRVIVHFFKDAHRVAVTDDECDCGSAYMDVEFHKSQTNIGTPRHQGCPFCDPIFVPMVTAYGLAKKPGMDNDGGRQTRGGGGGGGRGRRGRGGGRRRRGRGRGRRGRGRGGGYDSDDDYGDSMEYNAKPKEKMSLADFL
ncbi:DNA topoisomerase 3-beta-1-like [Rhopilema esculentum]|uniref:DNA topoisomerase 3-beta-1-like n=1 Tax=Rhopilema esculentum TaxID=499914 RepID=UPI0031D6D847|eukprot:gene11598-21835_t